MTDNSPHLMRPIPDEVWVRFFAGQSGRFIGSKFEDISLDILNRIFDRAWARTKSSHDGNKDFILNFESGTYWAESKAYKVALSYHVISPTLFMALVGEPDTIVFISRSPFNKNAKPLLAKYEKKTGKKIICIDGPLLDNVIIRNPDILEKFFPGNIFHSLPLEPFLAGVGTHVSDSRLQEAIRTANPRNQIY